MSCKEAGCEATLASFNKSGYCSRHYSKAESTKERAKAWYQENKERHKECNAEWRKNNPERSREIRRYWQHENRDKINERRKDGRKFWDSTYAKHKITAEEYWEMCEQQGGGCAICAKRPEEDFRGRLSVDHCHETGAIRGLLCNHCNLMLGHAKDVVTTLEKAILYLNKKKFSHTA